ncbi:MAG: sigma-70 family RNA polymerase sigma factor [Bacteroidales bacterium]|nr:sigma-70 family RNA polymerase sigma factor [Bacteroidales bacterium]
MAAVYQDIHREIIELSKAGNQKAQYQLYKLYSKAMFNICWRMLNNREEAEDLLQESFTDAFLKLDSFRYESSFGAWIKRIVINKCINYTQKRKIELIYPENIGTMDAADDEVVDYEGIDMDVKRVHEAVEKLPDGYRVIFSLYALEGYDHTEISEIMGVSESTSKTQYLRAKQKIKEILKSNGNEKRQVRTVHS